MNGVLRPVDNSGHIGHTCILNTNMNNIHVHQHEANMIMRNGRKHKLMPLLSPVKTCKLSSLFCQMKCQICRSWDCSGLFLYPIKQHGSHRPIDCCSKPYLRREKKIYDLVQELLSLLQS